ncbi:MULTISPECIES: MarR family transcriptional regulator [unclassified Paenibacillus]|uniref:MarR family winged helix-turn-helix transcriptional regulator n=1 Tax=unclassified Paenibacillus TaxID=185978 RepID=UPI002405D712|nr:MULTISPECIES: MarR family transcriptional regulator [unclassified Paenibacillus]MDF9840560.1 DNA-binding MarR family transcriptional regulator [Paenibacillus sp. PastF-2]MDF9847142.1 DNA-binding MarR family transcriptional regulator [Paenibacillus sp. PastM-2]MDF9853714.1 DNA-binding MarR family transcriptional regulator [Paenibacillus sp. PastF-1]MDH6478800.1 DNA-binding MarR family transcriptional regulator [Paenibacillus sp. PastH-2]MDH6506532.1 DNA-binding MarR family transcriptional re
MKNNPENDLIASWLSLTHIQMNVANELEARLQEKYQLSLKEFYLLLFLSEAPEKKLRLQQLEAMVGLSQSAVSRLVSRFEAKGCGALERKSCDSDRRSIYTSLTAIGQGKVDQARVTVGEVLAEAFPHSEAAQLLEQLARLGQQQ